MGVAAVVRLNNQTYDSSEFKERGIKHHELYFPDGTCPPKAVLAEFLSIAEKEPGALAVHCKAGLGRTGTLIGAFAIKHFHFNAADFIGWIRLCRPGSILGPQQFFLLEVEAMLKAEGESSPLWVEVKQRLSEEEVASQLKVGGCLCRA
jgi:cell division cycle 14